MIEAGSHPDLKLLQRLPRDEKKPEQGLARSIRVDQVRELDHFLGVKATYSDRRVVVIDTADDLERPGASNALLKNLEEPPAGTVFLLVSHAPGRLLPTIYATAGCSAPVTNARRVGREIAEALREQGVDAAIVTSTTAARVT